MAFTAWIRMGTSGSLTPGVFIHTKERSRMKILWRETTLQKSKEVERFEGTDDTL
jgi:hypothetical protein